MSINKLSTISSVTQPTVSKIVSGHNNIRGGDFTMEKYVPFEKLSKKKQRELNSKRRNTWGSISAVTRKPNSPKAYNRQKALKWKSDSGSVPFFFAVFPCQ